MEELIRFIANTKLGQSINGKYANSLQINGFILQQPKIIDNPVRKLVSCSFILHQINVMGDGLSTKTYSAITFLPKTVEEIKKINSVAFVNCLARIEWNPKLKNYIVVVHTLEVNCLIDKPLLPAYERKKYAKV